MRKTILCIACFCLAEGARAMDKAPASLNLSLADLTAQALENCPKLQAARLSWESARSEARSVGASEFPRLGLTGTYYYLTYIPQFTLPIPHFTQTLAIAENNNWSAWATLDWNLWDFRSQHEMADSATAASQSQEQGYQATQRQVKLAVRMAYFQAQTALEQVRLLGDSLKVAQAQYGDIYHQARFGTASRMDLLSSHQEVLNYNRQFWQAQSNLAQALRDLFDLVGAPGPADFGSPLDAGMQASLPDGISPPSVWLSMDPEKDSLALLQKEASAPPDDGVPQLKTYVYLADSSRLAADAVHSELLPKLTLSAQAGFENPDELILQTVQENTLSVSLNMPLFDWGQIVNDSDSKRKQSEAYLMDLGQAKTDLWRDWNKARDALRSLELQKPLDDTGVTETQELARLTYSSYRAGTVRFLEVQTANFQALDAKVTAVTNELQNLMQLSVLASLSGGQ